MSLLPHEVLTLTFGHLKKRDLLQCQLTNKQWHEASLKCLYADQYINSDETAVLYIRTISNSPHLRKYLNIIIFYSTYEKKSEGITHDVLDAVIQYCPNVTAIAWMEQEIFPFWTQLMHAASQGQLPCLKHLPQSSSKNLMSYIYTALSFKNSLVELCIRDERCSFGPQLARLGAYRKLCDQIDQFKKLEVLYFWYFSDKHLSYFDGLIDKCQHLKELTFCLIIKNILPSPNEPGPAIRPHPDIRKFECNWRLIDAESQVEYVIRKFPNLQKLRVTHATEEGRIRRCSGRALIKFILYAMSVPDFYINLDIKDEDLLNIWTEFIKTKNGSKKLSITYCSQNQPSNSLRTAMKLSSANGMNLVFPLITEGNEPKHVLFLTWAGETIRSLKVETSNRIPRITGAKSTTIEWLLEILQFCPVMEEITMSNPYNLSPSRSELTFPSVKRLNINGFDYTNSNNFLSCLSLNLPNLNQLSFNFHAIEEGYTEPITIHMPHTSLDLLTWNEGQSHSIENFKGAEIYIKLKTDAGIKFYVGIGNKLFAIDSDRYLFFSKHTRFDINCKHIKELRVRRCLAPESDANLIF